MTPAGPRQPLRSRALVAAAFGVQISLGPFLPKPDATPRSGGSKWPQKSPGECRNQAPSITVVRGRLGRHVSGCMCSSTHGWQDPEELPWSRSAAALLVGFAATSTRDQQRTDSGERPGRPWAQGSAPGPKLGAVVVSHATSNGGKMGRTSPHGAARLTSRSGSRSPAQTRAVAAFSRNEGRRVHHNHGWRTR